MGSNFFILGMPRTRTAWLSVLLSGPHSYCAHEGMNGHADFASYAESLAARPEEAVGDSNPLLVYYIDELTSRFPEARFLVVRRPEDESRRAYMAAAPEHAAGIDAGWAGYMAAFERAVRRLPECLEVQAHELDHFETCDRIACWLTGEPLERARWEQLRHLRITSTFPPVSAMPPAPAPVHESARSEHTCAGWVPAGAGFDFTGLSARLYTAEDRGMIESWWTAHRDAPHATLPLPPLGIIVEDARGPVAAIWCFETYGTGVAWIELPVTRPGLSLRETHNALAYAITAAVEMAGKSYEPPGFFTRFRVTCPPPMARVLKRLGFLETPQRATLLLSL